MLRVHVLALWVVCGRRTTGRSLCCGTGEGDGGDKECASGRETERVMAIISD